ncbi:interferon-related developmental regulator-domain-containing protein [Thamnocephalis sphaerospora]|uniref:Interferon-related developmental regulator-domain-containing protein n=1 Tax=Thamnocephalis sphaerospora TaxID=78915 RepID=A0A4P9XIK0_9FUNG|nr:interferon-related developmental regulator-domain-containing protein [Thamnocephalis sphaerospora]|eukprot:RKP05535.1 interferon-related developmental regulator-domain-containing protein [Thamnocephalis sphaerospora]
MQRISAVRGDRPRRSGQHHSSSHVASAGSSRADSRPNSRAASRASSRAVSRTASRTVSPEREHDDDHDEGLDSGDSDDLSRTEQNGADGARFRDPGWEDAFDTLLDDLSEKRFSTREAALTRLIAIMSHYYTLEKLDRCRETMVDALKRCVKREKSTHENALAMRALALCFTTLGAGQNALFQDLCFSLKYIITHTGSAELRTAGATALAVSCFVSSDDMADTHDLLNFYVQLLSDQNSAAGQQATALKAILNAYGLLFTCISDPGYARDQCEKAIGVHLKLLESPHTEVRVASGENIALMFEILQEANAKSSKRRGKKERSMQKTAVRDILHTIEDRQAPEIKLKFKQRVAVFDSWTKIRRLQMFRDVLGEGLYTHFSENELLQDIFEFGAAGPNTGRAAAPEVRQVHAPSSNVAKQRTRTLHKGRETRHAAIGAGHADDDWD